MFELIKSKEHKWQYVILNDKKARVGIISRRPDYTTPGKWFFQWYLDTDIDARDGVIPFNSYSACVDDFKLTNNF